jgi:hypothetical protein
VINVSFLDTAFKARRLRRSQSFDLQSSIFNLKIPLPKRQRGITANNASRFGA